MDKQVDGAASRSEYIGLATKGKKTKVWKKKKRFVTNNWEKNT